jgi:hypothetical protein
MPDTNRQHSNNFSRLLDVVPGTPLRHENLTLFPLVTTLQPELPYALLADALASGGVRIGEVGSGSVPSLLASNGSETDVLILDGEQLIGAKQNRITNRTIILEAKTETVIPVSCMEQGRWHDVSEEFRPRPKPRHAPPEVRRRAREVEAAYAATPSAASINVLHRAQGAVWNEIAQYGVDMGVSSETGAMDEIYDHHAESLDDWIAHFPCAEDQVGLLAFLGRRPIGLDVVGSQGLYSLLHERFLGGYVIDALARCRRGSESRKGGEGETHRPGASSAVRFLASVGAARRGHAPTVGKGTYHLLSGAAIGAELADVISHTERLVHLSAFPGQRRMGSETGGNGRTIYDDGPRHGPIASPSRRRSWARDRGGNRP